MEPPEPPHGGDDPELIRLFRFGGVVSRAAAGVLPMSWGVAWRGVGWGVWCAGWALTTLLNVLLYTSGAFSRRLTGVVNPEVALQTAKWRCRRPRFRALELSAARCSQAWRSGVVGRRSSPRPAHRVPHPARRRPPPHPPAPRANPVGLAGAVRGHGATDDAARRTTPSPARHRPHHPNDNHRNPDRSHHAGSTTPSNRKGQVSAAPRPTRSNGCTKTGPWPYTLTP